MSKGTIVSGGADGSYQVDVERDLTTVNARKSALQTQITDLDAQISTAETEMGGYKTAHADALVRLNDRITDYHTCMGNGGTEKLCYDQHGKAIIEAQKKALEASKEYRIVRAKVLRLKASRLYLQQKLAELNGLSDSVEISAWCADFTEDLPAGATVGLADVQGLEPVVGDDGTPIAPRIRPAFDDRAAYSQGRDGMLAPSQGQSKEALTWNWAMRPGWERWKPTFRGAVIDTLDGDTCSITLDELETTDQALQANPAKTFSDVPIRYMWCNGAAFTVGDHVLVEFIGQSRTDPMVVGFYDNPKPCTLGYFVFYPAAMEATQGWGKPFQDEEDPPNDINPPLGSVLSLPLGDSIARDAFRESIVKTTAYNSGTRAHLRAGDDYSGIYKRELQAQEAYHFQSWFGDSPDESLSIYNEDGNRYFGTDIIRGSTIYYDENAADGYGGLTQWGSKIFCLAACKAPEDRHVLGAAIATHQNVKYLYCVVIADRSVDLINQTFHVYRRVWQNKPYLNDDAYHADDNPLGWELAHSFGQPSYAGAWFTPSNNLTGQLGGAHFSPDGAKFVMMFRAYDTPRNNHWYAGYYAATISGNGTSVAMVWNANPAAYSTGYVIAADYDRSGNLVKLLHWDETATTNVIKENLRIVGGAYDVSLCYRHRDITTNKVQHRIVFTGLDLRTCCASWYYHGYDWNGASLDWEKYSIFTLDNGTQNETVIQATGTPAAIPTPNQTAATGTPRMEEFGLPIIYRDTYKFNLMQCDLYGNMLVSFTKDYFTYITSKIFDYTPTPPANGGYFTYLTGEADPVAFLGLNSYTNPGLVSLGTIASGKLGAFVWATPLTATGRVSEGGGIDIVADPLTGTGSISGT